MYTLYVKFGLPGGNRTHNRNLGGFCYIHLTTERICLQYSIHRYNLSNFIALFTQERANSIYPIFHTSNKLFFIFKRSTTKKTAPFSSLFIYFKRQFYHETCCISAIFLVEFFQLLLHFERHSNNLLEYFHSGFYGQGVYLQVCYSNPQHC